MIDHFMIWVISILTILLTDPLDSISLIDAVCGILPKYDIVCVALWPDGVRFHLDNNKHYLHNYLCKQNNYKRG